MNNKPDIFCHGIFLTENTMFQPVPVGDGTFIGLGVYCGGQVVIHMGKQLPTGNYKFIKYLDHPTDCRQLDLKKYISEVK